MDIQSLLLSVNKLSYLNDNILIHHILYYQILNVYKQIEIVLNNKQKIQIMNIKKNLNSLLNHLDNDNSLDNIKKQEIKIVLFQLQNFINNI